MVNKGFRLRMGNMLQAGPTTIHEVNAIGSSYVEATTSLFWHCKAFTNYRSCRIYCDAGGSEEFGFLNPLVRLAQWDRRDVIHNKSGSWPNVNVELIELSLDCPKLQTQIKSLQQQLVGLKPTHFGLPVRRDFGDANWDSSGHLKIETTVGWQSITREFWISDAPEFIDVFDTMISLIRRIGKTANLDRWVEHYDRSLKHLAENSPWYWNYQRPDTHPSA